MEWQITESRLLKYLTSRCHLCSLISFDQDFLTQRREAAKKNIKPWHSGGFALILQNSAK